MFHAHRRSIKVTVDKLLRSVSVAPDCQIEAHLNGAEPNLAEKLGLDVRIVGVDGQDVTDRGELREILLSGDGSRNVILEYEKTNEPSELVNIEESVKCDGEISHVVWQPSRDVVLGELQDEDTTTPISVFTPPSASLPKQSSRTSSPVGQSARDAHSATKTEGGDEDAGLVVSSSDFAADLMRPSVENNVSTNGSNPKNNVPDLLEFEKIDTPIQADDSLFPLQTKSTENLMRRRIMQALDMVSIGACVICVCQEVNPIAEIELMAMNWQRPIITIDLGVKLRLRPKPDEFVKQFKDAIFEGAWFVLINAHKSISSCRVLEEILREAEGRNYEGFNPNSKIIICMEPHPHFPRFLLKRAQIIKLQSSLSDSSSRLSMVASMSQNRLVTAESWCSQRHSGVSVVRTSDPGLSKVPCDYPRVRINASVDVVDIAPRDVMSLPRERPIRISGVIVLRSAFSGVPGDKFLCVVSAAVEGRFAVGSSMGNVYFVDELGNSLMQAHTHEAAIWDLIFKERYQFATGCEDGTATEWLFEMGESDGAALSQTSCTSLGNDIYCISYLQGYPDSPLLIGGLSHDLVLRGRKEEIQRISISSNAQVMECIPGSPVILVGGSDGSVTVVDITTASAVTSFKQHTRKLPALTVRDGNHFFTGSFDSTILSWDYRTPASPTGGVSVSNLPTAELMHTLKLKNYVTGLHANDVHLAASVGENLYLWDVRNLREVLGGYPQAWKGLSRGVRVNSASQCIVTASQDGYARFWSFV